MSNGQAIIYPTPADEIAVGGDLSGSLPNPKVVAIQGNPIAPQILGASQDSYVLTWNNTSNMLEMEPATIAALALQGDVTGTTANNTVGQRKTFLFMGA